MVREGEEGKEEGKVVRVGIEAKEEGKDGKGEQRRVRGRKGGRLLMKC